MARTNSALFVWRSPSGRALASVCALGLAGLGSTIASSAAAQDSPDLRDIRPVVMLLVDTSGSMERLPDCVCTSASCDECNPSCGGASDERNRWATVVEALTGTWTSYSCTQENRSAPAYVGQFDYRYYIDHFQGPDAAAPQDDDGILDLYVDRVKFGLMTFDPLGTFVGEEPLVDAASFSLIRNVGADGAYSYGEAKSFGLEGCANPFMMDNGGRNESSDMGRLVSVGDDTSASFTSINQTIQDVLKGIRPYGPTPIAGMLDDVEYYFNNHSDITPLAVAGGPGDPFAACRHRYAVLITDGYPNADMRDQPYNCASGTGSCPYRTPEETAASLCQLNGSGECDGDVEGVFVIGFAVDDTAAIARLNDIADQGGTGQALFAGDRLELLTQLSAALDRAAPGTTTRTVPAISTVGGGGASQMQLRFRTGFNVDDDEPWSGVLERERFTCDGINPVRQDVNASDRFHDTLDTQSTRKIYTVLPASAADVDAHLIGLSTGATDIDSVTVDEGNGASTVARGAGGASCGGALRVQPTHPGPAQSGLTLTEVTSANVSPLYFGLSASQTSERDGLVAWLRGESAPPSAPTAWQADINAHALNKLGDIYHSSPVVVGPPDKDIPDESYNLFRQTTDSRPTVVYVGSNDGLLHCFAAANANVTLDDGTIRAITAGEELWAYAVPELLPTIATGITAHQYTVDSTVVVQDVFLRRAPGSAADADIWRTVLLMGLRKGGNSYTALDVTDPLEPKFLWQFTSPQLGYTIGSPAVTQYLVNNDSVLEERALALLPGGSGEDLTGTSVDCPDTGCAPTGRGAPPIAANNTSVRSMYRCWGMKGRGFYFIDIGTGELIRYIDDQVLNVPVTGTPGVFIGNTGTIGSRAFVVDEDGVMHRIDFSSTDPDEWDIEPFYDMVWDSAVAAGPPGHFAPILAPDEQGHVIIIQATGNVDSLDATDTNSVVSLAECYELSGPGFSGAVVRTSNRCGTAREGTPVVAAVNWDVRLPNQLVTGPVELFDGKVYFAAFAPAEDPLDACQYGFSTLYGVDYVEPDPADPDVPRLPMPGLESISGSGVIDTRTLGPFSNQIIMGVAITQDPVCVVGGPDTDTFINPTGQRFAVSQAGGGSFSLVANVAGGSAVTGGSIGTITRALPTPAQFTSSQGMANRVF